MLSRLHQAKICSFFLQAKKEEEREKAVAAGNQRWEGAKYAEPWDITPQAAEDQKAQKHQEEVPIRHHKDDPEESHPNMASGI